MTQKKLGCINPDTEDIRMYQFWRISEGCINFDTYQKAVSDLTYSIIRLCQFWYRALGCISFFTQIIRLYQFWYRAFLDCISFHEELRHKSEKSREQAQRQDKKCSLKKWENWFKNSCFYQVCPCVILSVRLSVFNVSFQVLELFFSALYLELFV